MWNGINVLLPLNDVLTSTLNALFCFTPCSLSYALSYAL